jgi:hypothetical protein
MVGKSKNRKRAAEHKKIFTAASTFNKCEQKRGPQRKGMKIATFLPVAAGNSASFPIGWWQVFGHFPAAFLYPFSSAQRLFNSL